MTGIFPVTVQVGVRKYTEGALDSHRNPVVTFADAVPTLVYGYGPRSADGGAEPSKPGRDEVVIGLSVYGPPGLDIGPLDRVEVPLGGTLYEVDGEVGDWNHGPFGWSPGVSLALKLVEG